MSDFEDIADIQRLRQTLDLYERDRKLLAYEIHDGLAQDLTAAMLNFQAAHQALNREPQNQGHLEVQRLLQTGLQLLAQGIVETRRLISGQRPPILDESGVIAAIEHLVADRKRALDQKIEIEFVHPRQFGRLISPLENAIFRLVQEGLTNACRHSNSPRVRIVLGQTNDRVQIEIQDWGTGFDPQQVEETRFGLRGIIERARLLGGQATIESRAGQGTHIVADLPYLPCDSSSSQR